jgi:23S rRNA (adenine-N6)-dimethyltransferase
VSGRRPSPAPNPAGTHFLRDRSLVSHLVRASGARQGQLAFDLGAGHGAITAALALTGARVIAVERDRRLAGRLRARFDGSPLVRVVEADLRRVPLPHRSGFLVVASIPFSLTTATLRRLLGDPALPLAGADLILERGAARWLACAHPRDQETAWWAARYELRLIRGVAAASFVPPPAVDAAHLSVRPRPVTRSAAGQRLLRAMLRAAYRSPWPTAERVAASGRLPGPGPPSPRQVRRALARAGIHPDTPAAQLSGAQWHQVAQLRYSPAGAGPATISL